MLHSLQCCRHGKGVSKAVANINHTLGPAILAKCMDPADQEAVDEVRQDSGQMMLTKILLIQGDAGDGRDGRQVQAGGQRYPGRVHGGVQGGGRSQGYKQYRIIKYLEIDILQTFIIRQARSSHKPK